MKTLLYILFLVGFSTSFVSQTNNAKDYIGKILKSHKFVDEKNKVEELSKNTRTLVLISDTSASKNEFLSYKACEDNGVNYVTHIYFRVYPKSGVICIFDPLMNSETRIE